MKASDTYEEAVERLSAATGEAGFRAAVSRGYFAAFQHLRDHSSVGFALSANGSDHQNLMKHLNRQGLTRIEFLLRRLRLERNRCDYNLSCKITRELAEEVIDAAGAIIFDHLPA